MPLRHRKKIFGQFNIFALIVGAISKSRIPGAVNNHIYARDRLSEYVFIPQISSPKLHTVSLQFVISTSNNGSDLVPGSDQLIAHMAPHEACGTCHMKY
jgi:hypothetical protein